VRGVSERFATGADRVEFDFCDFHSGSTFGECGKTCCWVSGEAGFRGQKTDPMPPLFHISCCWRECLEGG
jgi:hypothetical protein